MSCCLGCWPTSWPALEMRTGEGGGGAVGGWQGCSACARSCCKQQRQQRCIARAGPAATCPWTSSWHADPLLRSCRHVRRAAVQVLSTGAHNKPGLIVEHLPAALPLLYQQTVVRDGGLGFGARGQAAAYWPASCAALRGTRWLLPAPPSLIPPPPATLRLLCPAAPGQHPADPHRGPGPLQAPDRRRPGAAQGAVMVGGVVWRRVDGPCCASLSARLHSYPTCRPLPPNHTKASTLCPHTGRLRVHGRAARPLLRPRGRRRLHPAPRVGAAGGWGLGTRSIIMLAPAAWRPRELLAGSRLVSPYAAHCHRFLRPPPSHTHILSINTINERTLYIYIITSTPHHRTTTMSRCCATPSCPSWRPSRPARCGGRLCCGATGGVLHHNCT